MKTQGSDHTLLFLSRDILRPKTLVAIVCLIWVAFGFDAAYDAQAMANQNDINNACPSSINFGETIACSIDSPAESDAYRFTANAGDKVLVRMSNVAELWSGVRIHGPTGDEVEGCREKHPTIAEIATCTLSDDGTYQIFAYDGYNGALTGDYYLFVQRLNAPVNSHSIDFDNVIQGRINTPAQVDTYSFMVKENSKVNVKMSNTDELWSGVRVYNSEGNEIDGCTEKHPTTAEIGVCELANAGAYHVLAYDGYNGTLLGNYSMSVTCLNPSCEIDDIATPDTDTPTPTDTPTTDTPATDTPTPTATPIVTDTPTPTLTPTNTPTHTPTPTTPQVDDLFSFGYELWTDPITLRANTNAHVALVVNRQGGKQPLSNVTVRFFLGNPENGGTLLGDGTISLLSPRGVESTSKVAWTVPTVGEHQLYAIIDPDDAIAETDETNNIISHTINVLPPTPNDLLAPRVDNFRINQGTETTEIPGIRLDTSVSDPSPSSGIDKIIFVEHEYHPESNRWSPTRESGWLDYTTNQSNMAWELQPSAGLKYLQVWASDGAGNISIQPFKSYINYMPPSDSVKLDQARVYRHELNAGDRFTIALTPLTGDPDLYVWAPDHETRPPWVSNLASGIDQTSFVAPVAGIYQVEVYGYIEATYQLTVDMEPATAVTAANVSMVNIAQEKPMRSLPYIALDSIPGIYMPPVAPTATSIQPTQFTLYLPTIQN